jgi:hypothetical protein
LIESNALTIANVLALCAPGTEDPTPFLYDTTMRTMAVLLTIALVNNYLMRPVDPALVVEEED